MAKTTETKNLERTYNIPLRKEYLKVPSWKRTKKAVSAVKQFLKKHMKAEEVKLGKHLNEELWKHGIKNPPHHVKVVAIKDGKGIVKTELFGHKIETKKEEKKKPSKLEEVAKKVGVKLQKPKVSAGLETSEKSQRMPAKKETKKEEKKEKPDVKKEEVKPAVEKKPETKQVESAKNQKKF